MGATTSAVVGGIDWFVDIVRVAVGLGPRPPSLSLKWAAHPKVRGQTALQAEMRRTVFARALIEQGEAVLFDGPVPMDGRIGVMPMMPEPIRVRVSQEGRNPAARHGTRVTETVIEPEPNGPLSNGSRWRALSRSAAISFPHGMRRAPRGCGSP